MTAHVTDLEIACFTPFAGSTTTPCSPSTRVQPVSRRMSELPLDDDQGHGFTGHLHRVSVSQLVKGKASPHPNVRGSPMQFGSRRGVFPVPASRPSGDDAAQRSDRKLEASLQPCLEWLPPPRVHADFAASSALALADEQRPASLIEVGFAEREGLLGCAGRASQDHDEASQPLAVRAVAGHARHGDDFLHLGRIRWIAEALLCGGRPAWNPGMVAGERRRPTRSSNSSDMAPPRASGTSSSLRSITMSGARLLSAHCRFWPQHGSRRPRAGVTGRRSVASPP